MWLRQWAPGYVMIHSPQYISIYRGATHDFVGAAYTCGNTNGYCAFYTTAGFGAVACCGDGSCDFRTDCKDQGQIAAGDCNNGCMNDIYTVKWYDLIPIQDI